VYIGLQVRHVLLERKINIYLKKELEGRGELIELPEILDITWSM
jgi:hypothetical protein